MTEAYLTLLATAFAFIAIVGGTFWWATRPLPEDKREDPRPGR